MLASLWAPAGCGSQKSGLPAEPTQLLQGLTMVESLAGKRKWDLTAKTAVLHEAEERIDVETPYVKIQENGRDVTRMRADRGRYHTASRDMEMLGHVVAESLKERSTLYTEQLHFDGSGGKMWTEKAVRIVRADGNVQGTGLEATPDLSEITIKHQTGKMK